MSPIKNVVLVGASGRLFGPQILKALQASSQNFNITLLTRASSTATFPDGLKVIRHNYDDANLATVLKELDIHAMVVTIAGTAIIKQLPLIDACAKSGTVRRFIPTEFGADGQNATVQELVPVYAAAAKCRSYLNEVIKSNPQLSYTNVATGMWIDFTFRAGYLPYDAEKGTCTIWDDGNVRTSYTTIGTSALAVVRVLEREEETKNKYLYVAEITASQNEIVAAFESIMGKKFEVAERKSTEEAAEQSKKLWKKAFEEFEAAGGEEGTGQAAPFDPAAMQLGFAKVIYGPGRESDWKDKHDNALLGIETLEVEPFFRELLGKK